MPSASRSKNRSKYQPVYIGGWPVVTISRSMFNSATMPSQRRSAPVSGRPASSLATIARSTRNTWPTRSKCARILVVPLGASVGDNPRADQGGDRRQFARALGHWMQARRAPKPIADSGLEPVERAGIGERADLRAEFGELRDRHVLAAPCERGPRRIQIGDGFRGAAPGCEIGERERRDRLARGLARIGPRSRRGASRGAGDQVELQA